MNYKCEPPCPVCYRGVQTLNSWGARPAEGQKDFVSTLRENFKAHSDTVNNLPAAWIPQLTFAVFALFLCV